MWGGGRGAPTLTVQGPQGLERQQDSCWLPSWAADSQNRRDAACCVTPPGGGLLSSSARHPLQGPDAGQRATHSQDPAQPVPIAVRLKEVSDFRLAANARAAELEELLSDFCRRGLTGEGVGTALIRALRRISIFIRRSDCCIKMPVGCETVALRPQFRQSLRFEGFFGSGYPAHSCSYVWATRGPRREVKRAY
jgi:hypothetical protein